MHLLLKWLLIDLVLGLCTWLGYSVVRVIEAEKRAVVEQMET